MLYSVFQCKISERKKRERTVTILLITVNKIILVSSTLGRFYLSCDLCKLFAIVRHSPLTLQSSDYTLKWSTPMRRGITFIYRLNWSPLSLLLVTNSFILCMCDTFSKLHFINTICYLWLWNLINICVSLPFVKHRTATAS